MSYPLLGIFWTMLEFFLFVVWIWVLVLVVMDIFRSHDLSGGAKALWVLFVVVLPMIGVLVYLIARGSSMAERGAVTFENGSRRAAPPSYAETHPQVTPTDEVVHL